ncbi:MAG: regulator [Candidatus Micrarchaeota archaeon]
MYQFLEDVFVHFPQRRKVAEVMLRYGLRIDENGNIFCGEIEIAPAKFARGINTDRRVVIETAKMIAKYEELYQIFSNLKPTAYIRGAAKQLGFEVLEIHADPHAAGIVSKVTELIAQAKIPIRQIVTDDPDIYPEPKLTIVLGKKMSGNLIAKLKSIKEIKRLIVG